MKKWFEYLPLVSSSIAHDEDAGPAVPPVLCPCWAGTAGTVGFGIPSKTGSDRCVADVSIRELLLSEIPFWAIDIRRIAAWKSPLVRNPFWSLSAMFQSSFNIAGATLDFRKNGTASWPVI
jgi:hypothetical protein